MKTNAILLLTSIAIGVGTARVDAADTNGLDRVGRVAMSCSTGTVDAIAMPIAQGRAVVMLVPDHGLIWVGSPLPGEKYVCHSNAITRLASDCDELLVDRQTTRCEASSVERQSQTNRIAIAFAARLNEGLGFGNVQRLSLGEIILGDRALSPFLPPAERVRPAPPAAVSQAMLPDGRVIVTLTGQNKTMVVLTFTSAMTLATGELNGKVVYPRENAPK